MPEVVLSCKELSILLFIQRFQQEKGYAPTMREIGKELGIPSTSLISWYLGKLERAKKIKRDPQVARSIVLLEVPNEPNTTQLV